MVRVGVVVKPSVGGLGCIGRFAEAVPEGVPRSGKAGAKRPMQHP